MPGGGRGEPGFGAYIPNGPQRAPLPSPPGTGTPSGTSGGPWLCPVGTVGRGRPLALHQCPEDGALRPAPGCSSNGGQQWGSTRIAAVASLLRINGHPGNYVRIAGKWRLEEVSHLPWSSLTPQHNSCSSIPCCPARLWESQLPPAAPALAKQPLGPGCPAGRVQLLSPCPFTVPPQRLHHRPLHPDGHHHDAQADHQQRDGVSRPVSFPPARRVLAGAPAHSGHLPSSYRDQPWSLGQDVLLRPASGVQGCHWQQFSPAVLCRQLYKSLPPLAAG